MLDFPRWKIWAVSLTVAIGILFAIPSLIGGTVLAERYPTWLPSAKISLGLRVLSVNDLGFDHKGGNLFMTYLRSKEQLATRSQAAPLSSLGITGIP